MRRRGIAALACLAVACGRSEPRLFAVVATSADAPDACLPLREPSLSTLPPAELEKLRPPTGDYVWLVGERVEGPAGIDAALSAVTGRNALVSLTSDVGGTKSTRAVATVEKGEVTHTYFGTPLTPAFANEDGTQLALTFGARMLDPSGLKTAKAVLGALPAGGPEYGAVLSALVEKKDDATAADGGFSQTYVLRDSRSCGSGACRAVLADERLVMLDGAPDVTRTQELCLKGTRLFDDAGASEHTGAYAVLHVVHARLPEEALGPPLASALEALARCGSAPASKATEALDDATTLRPDDRQLVATLVKDAATSNEATTAEERLEAVRRLTESSGAICDRTPAEGILCARSKAILACARSRATGALAVADAYAKARHSVDALDRATTCETRAPALVALSRDLGALASTSKQSGLAGTCEATDAGLSCEAFPKLSQRAHAVVAEAQDALYRRCYCPAVADDRSPLAASRMVHESLACAAAPESFALAPAPDAPLAEADRQAWEAHAAHDFPAFSALQCPACVRLARRVDDELARAATLGRRQAEVANLLRRALAPIDDLHDRAFVLMSGDIGVRCAARPDEWALINEALRLTIDPADLFRANGEVDPARLDAKLDRASLLSHTLAGLDCARESDGPSMQELPRLTEKAR